MTEKGVSLFFNDKQPDWLLLKTVLISSHLRPSIWLPHSEVKGQFGMVEALVFLCVTV